MAQRLSLPSLPRLSAPLDRARLATAWADAKGWRPPRGQVLHLLLYRIAWLPLWLSSDLPAPLLPVRDEPLPAGGPAGDHVARVLGQLQRRLWVQRILSVLFRAAWLPLLVGVVWVIIELRGGPELRFDLLLWAGIVLLIPAAVFAYLVRPSRWQVARMLDRSFALQDRLQTAVENVGQAVPEEGERARITYLQMADAANVLTDLRAHPAFRVRLPVREIVLAIACALLLGALFFVRGVGGGVPPTGTDTVPAFIPAAERLAAEETPVAQAEAAPIDAPTREQVQARAERSNQAQQDLKKLGDALADQAVTRSVSEAIERGDYAAAADLLRNAAANADQWSQAARDALASDLDAAAGQMAPGDNQLADAAREAADGLRQGGEAAKEGVSNLGDAVDQTASDIVSQQELADQMRQASAAEQQRAEGDAQAGSDSSQSDASSGSDGSQSDAQSGQDGQEGSQSGSGADAQPGQGSEGDQSQQSGETSSGTGEQSAGSDSGQPGQEGQPQPGEGPGQPSSSGEAGQGQAGSQGQPAGQSGNQEGQTGEGGDAGAGAGSGQGQEGEQPGGSQQSGDSKPGAGENSDPNATDANATGENGTEASKDPRSAITLSRSPDGSGVQTSGNGGASSVGSGSGASVGGGDSTQGEVGVAGPDSNRVPPAYRGIVEDYFSDPDGS